MKIEKKEKLIKWIRKPKNKELLRNRDIIFLIIMLVVAIIVPRTFKGRILINLCIAIWLISYIGYHIRIGLFELDSDTIRKNNMILIFLATKNVWETFMFILGILVAGLFVNKVNFIGCIIIAIIIICISTLLSNKISKYFKNKLK